MTKQVQLRRGTTAEHAVFTGAVGELTIDTDLDVAVVHDGSKVGGYPLVGTAATQAIVNKTGIGIGTTNASSNLTVIGTSKITGISSFGNNVDISGNIDVNGTSEFSGIGSNYVRIGSGSTDFVVKGTARITDTLSIGQNTIVLNGNNNTITAQAATFGKLNISDDNVILESYTKTVYGSVSAGSASIPLFDITNLIVGDYLNISGIFTNTQIVGFGTTSVGGFYNTQGNISVAATAGIGTTIIGLSTDVGLSTSSYISIVGIFTNVAITGFTTITLPPSYTSFGSATISTSVSAGSTIIPTSNVTNVDVGEYVSVSGIITNVQIVGLTTVALPSFYQSTTTTSITTSVSAGSTIIGVGVSQGGGFINVSGIFTNVPVVGYTTVPLPAAYVFSNGTTISTSVSVGSTIIGVGDTTKSVVGDYIDISGIFNKVQIVGFTTVAIGTGGQVSGAFLIGVGNTYNGTISAGTAVTTYTLTPQQSFAVLIGTAYTYGGTISAGTALTYSNFNQPYSNAVLIGTANTSTLGISSGTSVTFSTQNQNSYPAVIIGAGNTYNGVIGVGTTGTYSILSSTRPTVLIGTANTSALGISSGTSVTVNRLELSESSLAIDRLNVSGIATLASLKLNGLNFPTTDGKKGQVLATDGAGNIGFTTGGGGGGADIMLYVSTNTGNDANDGKTLPVKTIKRATQIASKVGKPVTIMVETGEYFEDNPIICYDEVSIIGDSLRNVVVRPLNAGKDLFKVRNGNYLTGLTFNDNVNPTTRVPQFTYDYSVAFDDPYDANLSRTGYAATTIYTITNAQYDYVSGLTTVTTSVPHELYRENGVRLTGIAWTCGYDEAGIQTAVYNNVVGVTTITLYQAPSTSTLNLLTNNVSYASSLRIGDSIFPNNLPFTCPGGSGITTTIFPYVGLGTFGAVYTIIGINTAAKTVTIQGGISTIAHTYVGFNTTGISTLVNTPSTGITTITTSLAHELVANDNVTLSGLAFTAFSFSNSGFDGKTYKVSAATTTTVTINTGIGTTSAYTGGGFVRKVPTIQKVLYYPDSNPGGIVDFGVISVGSSTQFTARCSTTRFPHYYTQGGTARLSKPIINKSPYINNCSILSFLGGNGILVDGNKVASSNKAIVPAEGEKPPVGDQPDFGKSMVAATFTMISFGGIGWRTINDGYAQVVSCFQIFCRYASLTQSGGYLSITNSATNFGDFALRSTGFSPNSFVFDRSRIVSTGTKDGLQTLKVVGLGRTEQDLYVMRFIDDAGVDRTGNFKPVVTTQEFTGGAINTSTSTFTIAAHPFSNLDLVTYLGDEQAATPVVVKGLVSGNQYYVGYVDASNFQLYSDDGLTKLVSLGSTFVGINTFQKNNQEFFVSEIFDTHNSYQVLTLAGAGSTAKFNSGAQVTQTVTGGTATGFALTYTSSTRQLIVSVEASGGTRRFFSASGGNITDNSASPISIGVTAVAGLSTYYTTEFKLDSTTAGTVVAGISSLPINYRCHFNRPSIINSSAHTWEYSGSGTDYNALPQNGGKGKASTEQVAELGGRVYASGTNELGDFKIGKQIVAYNRTGNIVFNNKVTIGQLDSIRLSLSGGIAIEEFSTDVNLGDTETGGPQNKRVSTQLAVRSFLSNRLGTFIDKTVSTNAVPGAVVQLNTNGQINADLIPPKVVNYSITPVGGGRTVLVNRVPATNILQGDTVVEPTNSYLLVNDVVSQYLILGSATDNYAFNNGDVVTSALASGTTGIVTAPPQNIGIGTSVAAYVGYGTTGLVKGTILSGSITAGGSGYSTPGIYTCFLQAVTGIGTSGYATITVGAAGTVTSVALFGGGRYYAAGDVVNVSASLIGGRSGGSDFQYTIGTVETRLYLKLTANQKFTGSSALADYIADARAGVATTSLTVGYAVTFTPTDTGVGGNIDFTNNRIIVGVNSLSSGDPVIYDTQGGNMIVAAGLGINDQGTYYVKKVGAGTSVELYREYSLTTVVDLTGSGTGTHRLLRNVVNVPDERLVLVGHGYSTGTALRVSGNVPTGITTGAFYYTGSITTNSFSLHLTQYDALASVSGVTFNAVGFAATSSGNMTFTKQNVRYAATVNTSSSDINNWSLLARSDIDASNIVSGIINTSRLGGGTANTDTFLSGNSTFQKVIKSVGIGTTQPIGVSSYSSADLAPGGVGFNTYYGDIKLTINRASGSALDTYSTLGVARFKTSTFTVDGDGNVSIKNSVTGDIDAVTLSAQTGSYYLNSANHTGTVPITRGGTGLTGVPSAGYILIGNGSAYNLTNTPTFTGIVNFSGGTASTTSGNGQVIITGGLGVSGNINLGGTLNAVSKSFLIDHPTKPGYKLQYGSLEGPENGVYVRGKLSGTDTIQLPDYWTGLVDEDTITVTLTPIGSTPILHSVVSTSISEVKVASEGEVNCYYVVYAERKDTDKLVVEFPEHVVEG